MKISSLLIPFLCAVPGSLASPAAAPPVLRTILPTATYSVPFSKKVPRRNDALSVLRRDDGRSGSQTTIPLAGSDFDSNYVINATIGGQNFTLLIDTGSADIWVPQQGFSCLNLTGSPVPLGTCNFGTAGLDINASKTFEPFENVSINITYGTGFFVAGPVGFETVSIGGLDVSHQEVPVPNVVGWVGDGVQSGVLGLGFPALTSVFNTTDPTTASAENHVPYDPFFFTAVKEQKVEHPFFSIALNRPAAEQQEHDYTPNLGFLSFGGIAPVPVIHNTSTTVPIIGFPTNATTANETYIWHTIAIDSYNFPGSENIPEARNASLANGTTIIDTGTALNLVPASVAAGYAAAFDPPAELTTIGDLSLYVAPCNATVPPFSVTIGGQAFSMDARDQLLTVTIDAQGDVACICGTQARGAQDISADFHLLGDSFLKNVVATFNPIAKEVTLTQRVSY
ncbi:aspartic peptidase domain-containing protein [Mycena galopus ATCC 62051]|nr:aspartic peptidase domain-containing protein [Mycena galopus ATCC 62051]